MNKWAQRLASLGAAAPLHATAETDETGVLSVLAVPAEKARGKNVGEGRLTLAARQLPEDARQLLDCLIWLQPDTGALTAKELALACRLPTGLMIRVLNSLLAAGLATHVGRGVQVSAALLDEIRRFDHARMLCESVPADSAQEVTGAGCLAAV